MPSHQCKPDSFERVGYRQEKRELLAPEGQQADRVVYAAEQPRGVVNEPVDGSSLLEDEYEAPRENAERAESENREHKNDARSEPIGIFHPGAEKEEGYSHIHDYVQRGKEEIPQGLIQQDEGKARSRDEHGFEGAHQLRFTDRVREAVEADLEVARESGADNHEREIVASIRLQLFRERRIDEFCEEIVN